MHNLIDWFSHFFFIASITRDALLAFLDEVGVCISGQNNYLGVDFLTLKPQYPHTNSPNWSLYISIKNKLREFDKRSKHFPSGDRFTDSHNPFS